MIVGIGIDIAEVARFEFDEVRLARFAKKIFTQHEMEHAVRHRHRAERLAGAFAAKEAARKAFGHWIPWRSVGVRHHRTGRPYLELNGSAAGLIAARAVAAIHLTISHSRTTAVAVVILEADVPVIGRAQVYEPREESAAK